MRRTTLLFAGLLAVLAAVPARAVTITIVNKDAAGQGLNDPTPATPVGGNPGTTIGQQRLNVFKKAAEIWSGILPGNVDIRVYASFSSTMSCDSTTAVLGGTSPNYVESDFGAGEMPGVWYVVAEASQLAGYDLEPGNPHMTATFNARLGQTGCLNGSYFYYGFDTNTPTSGVNLLAVTLHEFAHGLGFISLADETTGAFCCDTMPLPDIFDAFVYDTKSGKSWNDMATDADRKASATNTGSLVWTGPAANAAGAAYLSKNPFLKISSPSAAAGSYTVGTAEFGSALTLAGVSGTMIAATDAIEQGGSPTDACSSPLTNASAVAGKIALVDRGGCNFTVKAANVQAAGGIGVVVANNQDGSAPNMGGSDPTITIPVVSVTLGDGAKLRTNLPASATIGLDPSRTSGMNTDGQMLLYAPNPVKAGSSVSHWDTSAIPHLLLEPNINNSLPIGVDITPDLFRDIGWFGGNLPPQRLTVTMAGSGRGTVTSSPAGLSCSTNCSFDFAFNAVVTLTAAATGSSTFAGWSGEGCSGTGTCQVTMSVARNVTATFNAPPPPPATILPTAGYGTCSGGGCTAPYTGTVGIPLAVAPFRGGTQVTSGSVSWQVTSGNAVPSFGTGLTFTFTPQTPGNFVVTATVDGVAASSPLTVAIAAAPPALALSNNRVLVSVAWLNPYSGQGGAAFSLPQNDEFGMFYYADPNNPEVFVKVLDFGTGNALCFVGGLTDFYYKVTFTMLRTGQPLVFEKPAYQYVGYVNTTTLEYATAPGGMTFVGALTTGEAPSASSAAPVERPKSAMADTLAAVSQSLTLSSNRVSVTVDWRNPYSGETGRAYGIPKADPYGFFYYADPGNPEVFVKVLDFGDGIARVFVGGLTDFYYKVTFTVLRTGQPLVFEKPANQYVGFVDATTLKF